MIQICFIQGNFANWFDGKLLLFNNWVDPDKYPFLQSIQIIIRRDGRRISKLIEKPSFDLQPESSRNCTVGFRNIVDLYFAWTTVLCDQPIDAAYACQKEKHLITSRNSLLVNTSCSEGWIKVNGTQKCYLFLESAKPISFLGAQKQCSLENGRVLSIKHDQDVFSKTVSYNNYMLDHLKRKFWSNYMRHMPKHITGMNINTMIFGGLLDKQLPDNRVASISHFTLSGHTQTHLSNHITLYAFLDSNCGIVQHTSAFSSPIFLHGLPSQYYRTWGAKYRSCDSTRKVDAIVCEKQSEPYLMKACGENHFECKDQTCILSIYRCDSVTDCFDKSDENHCESVTQNVQKSLTKQVIYIPCQLNDECDHYDDHTTLYIHSVCDGIYSQSRLVKEKYACYINTRSKIDLLGLSSQPNFNHRVYEINLLALFVSEHRLRILQQPHVSFNSSVTYDQIDINVRRMAICRTNVTVDFDKRCQVSVHITPCNYGFTKQICQDISCGRMFKCRSYYCIYMSSVCDGQRDCLYGDDEDACDNLFCPGQLKCRGENRCVSTSEVCDGYVDCLFSPDDEGTCLSCPDECQCKGYVALCKVFNFNIFRQIYQVKYLKGLIVAGTNVSLKLDNIVFKYLVYLEISACSLTNVTFHSSFRVASHVLFLNLSINHISSLKSLSIDFFENINVLDVGQNVIANIKRDDLRFKYLAVLYLKNNPIVEINSKNIFLNLKLIDVSDIFYNPLISISLPDNSDVVVSDSMICCVLSPTINCRIHAIKILCFGLFDLMHLRYIFYTFVIFSLSTFSASILKIGYDKPWTNYSKRYYTIAQLNYIISEFMSIQYFMALMVVDTAKVNVILWRQNIACLLLRTIIGVTLETSLIFKILSVITVALKIIYPFKHQLSFLKIIPVMYSTIWIMVVSLQICNMVVKGLSNKVELIVDTFCTHLDCHGTLKSPLQYALFIDIMCLVIFWVTVGVLVSHLKRSNIKKRFLSIKKLPTFKITFKLGRSFIFEMILRLLIFSVIWCEYFKVTYPHTFCFAVVLYVVPMNIIISKTLYLI